MKLQKIVYFLFLYLISLGWEASLFAEDNCKTLKFVSVKPVIDPIGREEVENKIRTPELEKICKQNKTKCTEIEGFKLFNKVTVGGKDFYSLERDRELLGGEIPYITRLQKSKALYEVNQFKIVARKIAKFHNPCEPNLVYLGKTKIFGLGPVFVDSSKFLFEGKIYTNFLAAEDAKIGPKAILTKDGLIRNGYLDIALGHELAHGIMQDLYGINSFPALFSGVISKDGHNAAAITDPALAWIEGFAEGFEAYLGEKFLTFGQQQTPAFDRVMQIVDERADAMQTIGSWKSLPGGIISIPEVYKILDDVVIDFLVSDRQSSIRRNEFVNAGVYPNLLIKYNDTNFLDPTMFYRGGNLDNVSDIIPFMGQAITYDQVISREGVVAHLVYSILKAGLYEKMFEVIHRKKPKNVAQFANYFMQVLDKKEFTKIRPALASIFTKDGRIAVSGSIHYRDRNQKNLSSILSKIKLPNSFSDPRAMWIEFEAVDKIRKYYTGTINRLNLATTSNANLFDFLDRVAIIASKGNISPLWTMGEKLEYAKELIAVRDSHPEIKTVRAVASGLRRKAAAYLKSDPRKSKALFLLGNELNHAEACFLNRCLSE